ncbi:uncharacterized protein [Venturia canescens]|uniref:uncharacterized protein n=1 Tax=Venturia canescens TaxID=32260 RepID=UPI001C9D4ACE|nr:uncharacterized protein LOC122418338 [Venturia canescens]
MSGPNWESIERKVDEMTNSDGRAEGFQLMTELPKQSENNMVTIAGVEWNYNRAVQAARTHRDTVRVVALANSLWPDEEIRKKLVLRKTKNSPKHYIEIDLKDLTAIRNAAEELDGIRNLHMRE